MALEGLRQQLILVGQFLGRRLEGFRVGYHELRLVFEPILQRHHVELDAKHFLLFLLQTSRQGFHLLLHFVHLGAGPVTLRLQQPHGLVMELPLPGELDAQRLGVPLRCQSRSLGCGRQRTGCSPLIDGPCLASPRRVREGRRCASLEGLSPGP